jgi:hypothetical protein
VLALTPGRWRIGLACAVASADPVEVEVGAGPTGQAVRLVAR